MWDTEKCSWNIIMWENHQATKILFTWEISLTHWYTSTYKGKIRKRLQQTSRLFQMVDWQDICLLWLLIFICPLSFLQLTGITCVILFKFFSFNGYNGNKRQKTKHWWYYGESGSLKHCRWEWEMIQQLWKTVWWFLFKLNIDLHRIQKFCS